MIRNPFTRRKREIAVLRNALYHCMKIAGAENIPAYDTPALAYHSRIAVRTLRETHDATVDAIKAARALKAPFTPQAVVVVGFDKTGPLAMGCARLDGTGEFATENLGRTLINTPGGIMRIPKTAHSLTARFGQYTLVRGKDHGAALGDLLANEPGLADVLRSAVYVPTIPDRPEV